MRVLVALQAVLGPEGSGADGALEARLRRVQGHVSSPTVRRHENVAAGVAPVRFQVAVEVAPQLLGTVGTGPADPAELLGAAHVAPGVSDQDADGAAQTAADFAGVDAVSRGLRRRLHTRPPSVVDSLLPDDARISFTLALLLLVLVWPPVGISVAPVRLPVVAVGRIVSSLPRLRPRVGLKVSVLFWAQAGTGASTSATQTFSIVCDVVWDSPGLGLVSSRATGGLVLWKLPHRPPPGLSAGRGVFIRRPLVVVSLGVSDRRVGRFWPSNIGSALLALGRGDTGHIIGLHLSLL